MGGWTRNLPQKLYHYRYGLGQSGPSLVRPTLRCQGLDDELSTDLAARRERCSVNRLDRRRCGGKRAIDVERQDLEHFGIDSELPVGELLQQHRLEQGLIRRADLNRRHRLQPRREVREGDLPPAGSASCRDQHIETLLARKVEEVKQRLLVIGETIGILDHERRPLTHRVDHPDIEGRRLERSRARERLEHAGEMSLAACRRARQELDAALPTWPGVDQPYRREVAVADEEVLGAERRAMGEVKGELGESHEALTRERSAAARPCSAPWRLCDRRGSGSGS